MGPKKEKVLVTRSM